MGVSLEINLKRKFPLSIFPVFCVWSILLVLLHLIGHGKRFCVWISTEGEVKWGVDVDLW
jgi:hypothetical protein